MYGSYDPQLFPTEAFRECCVHSLARSHLPHWTPDFEVNDVPDLIQQIRLRLLPKRGVFALQVEILITPSHQSPTTATLSMRRRALLLNLAEQQDFVVIEDDYEAENLYEGEPMPALKSMDKSGRVIHVGSVSKSLSPSLTSPPTRFSPRNARTAHWPSSVVMPPISGVPVPGA